jgi:hypothetical protein
MDANGVTVLASAGGLITALAQLNTDVYMSNNRFIYGKDTGGTTRGVLGLNNGNTLHLGDGNIPTWINGAGIRFNTHAYLGWGFSLYMVGDDSVNYSAVGFDSAQNLWIGSSASGLVLAAPAIGGGRGALIKAYSTEYPAGSMLWHEHNGGPSSGLNADLLDGIEGAAFVQTTAPFASAWAATARGSHSVYKIGDDTTFTYDVTIGLFSAGSFRGNFGTFIPQPADVTISGWSIGDGTYTGKGITMVAGDDSGSPIFKSFLSLTPVYAYAVSSLSARVAFRLIGSTLTFGSFTTNVTNSEVTIALDGSTWTTILYWQSDEDGFFNVKVRGETNGTLTLRVEYRPEDETMAVNVDFFYTNFRYS